MAELPADRLTRPLSGIALSHPLLPLDDGRAAGVLVELSRTACDTFDEKAAVVRQLHRAPSQDHHPGVRVGIAGRVVGEAISRHIRKDLSCSAIVLVHGLLCSFRGWAVPLISMAVAWPGHAVGAGASACWA